MIIVYLSVSESIAAMTCGLDQLFQCPLCFYKKVVQQKQSLKSFAAAGLDFRFVLAAGAALLSGPAARHTLPG